MGTVELVGNIVLSGMNLLSEGRRLKIQRAHKEALDRLSDASNNHFPIYNDAELALADQALQNLVVAFHSAILEQVEENNNA